VIRPSKFLPSPKHRSGFLYKKRNGDKHFHFAWFCSLRVSTTRNWERFFRVQLRLHPATTREVRLAEEHPATFIAFDLLVGATGKALLTLPLKRRRSALESFMTLAGESATRSWPTGERHSTKTGRSS
jgi:hypothetical protein